MTQFKVRDLMINVMAEGGPGKVPFCIGVTYPNCGWNTCANISFVGCVVTICQNITRCFQVTLLEAGSCAEACASCDACSLRPCSQDMCTGGCSEGCTAVASLGCPNALGTRMLADPTEKLRDLAILKQELKRTLEQVEAQERVLEESMKPKTLEEIQLLEAKLIAALEELKTRKSELGSDPHQQ